MDALIGYTGFVGSHLIRPGIDVYNSKTIQQIADKTYNTIYCAGVYAEKWKANKDPETDRLHIQSLINCLSSVKCNTFVLISTVDVYESTISQSEEPDCCPNVYASHSYGKNRLELENWVRATFSKTHIFRLPALFGNGLKKNALYDLIHKNQIDKLRSNWSFQWYNLNWLWTDIQYHIKKEHPIVNLVTQPISMKLINALFFPDIHISRDDSKVEYRIGSIYRYSHTQEEVLLAMAEFVRKGESNLLVSELSIPLEHRYVFESFLRMKGVTHSEIVPSKRSWDMSGYTNAYSAQSILYGVDIQIFQEPDRFLDVLRDRLEKLHSVGVKIIVFGSPKQRIYSGEDARTLFRRVGDLCQRYGITLCLENNASYYGGNWMHTIKDTVDFVESVNHPCIAVNLDTGSMLLEGETVVPPTNKIRHVQVSFPKLTTWDLTFLPSIRSILIQLHEYRGKISLEMMHPCLSSIQSFLEEFSPSQISR